MEDRWNEERVKKRRTQQPTIKRNEIYVEDYMQTWMCRFPYLSLRIINWHDWKRPYKSSEWNAHEAHTYISVLNVIFSANNREF